MVLSLESHLAVHESPASARCRKLEEGKRDRFHVQHMQVAAYFDYGLFTLSCHGKLDSIPKEPHFQRYVMQMRKLLKRQIPPIHSPKICAINQFAVFMNICEPCSSAAARRQRIKYTLRQVTLSGCPCAQHISSTTFECSARDSETKPNS